MAMAAATIKASRSPTLCLFNAGDSMDHYSLFALSEINSGMYHSTLGNITFQHKLLYADPSSLTAEGETQSVFSSDYESCHIFVGPSWTTQLAAIGEWAGLEHKPIITGGATSPIFTQDNFGYVSRSIPSDLYVLKAFVGLIVEYGLDLINIVHVNDEYGQSVTTALVDLSKGLFKIQLLQTFDGADDVEGINKALDDLEDSPTSVTFLGVTSLEIKMFLNIAGSRGMHDDHLWLSPKAVQVAGELAGSTGGIWGISYGEELTEESPLAQRYLAKDPAPHIEAMEHGFQDNYDILSYWGAYAYDAVLAAAHGLATATNISDGEQVLKEIRGLSLNNTNTGLLKMDEYGDRIGARIPVFFVTPAGTAEQFAVYEGGTVSFIQEPLWPGGATTQPTDLIQEDGNSHKAATIGGILGGLVVVLSTVFFVIHSRYRKAMKAQQETLDLTKAALNSRESELQQLRNTINSSIGKTKYGDAVAYVDTLLDRDVDKDEMEKLALLKSCLVKGDDTTLYVPENLGSMKTEEAYILQNFGGVNTDAHKAVEVKKSYRTSTTSINTALGVQTAANKFLANKRKRDLSKRIDSASIRNYNSFIKAMQDGQSPLVVTSIDCLPEFKNLEVSQQTKMFELLSWNSLKKWNFNVFDVASIDEDNALLFVSWAILCSPYSHIAMARELELIGNGEDKLSGMLDIDDFEGYDFFDMDLAIDSGKLCKYIRAIQGDYQDVPYHNRVHAADVVQSTNSLIQMSDESISFQKEDLFVLLFASVIHDVKHPGRNNTFQVNTFSDLSLAHNDQSVLENEHASHAFKLMVQTKECHFLHNVKPSKFAELRKKIVQAILHTDMTSHFATTAKIKSTATGKPWDELESSTQWEVLMYMLHMADISNPAKGDPMFKLWTDRCLEEFFAQGDKEQEMGLAISMMCDRKTTKRPDSQIGFIDFVVKPSYEVLAEVMPQVGKNVLPVIENNLEYWKREKDLEVIAENEEAGERG